MKVRELTVGTKTMEGAVEAALVDDIFEKVVIRLKGLEKAIKKAELIVRDLKEEKERLLETDFDSLIAEPENRCVALTRWCDPDVIDTE